ncbi:unnamed protein product [Rodentolepis nana]|uniref:RNA-directed RNA polymerase n=1 Tax=Rodentolepis nana TaxID=102285 RepID=A0A0R3T9G0_RODNA|nr:unnamed protein product [Rodentolepis nana]
MGHFDDVDFLCINDGNIFFRDHCEYADKIEGILIFTRKSSMYSFLLDVYKYGSAIALQRRKRPKLYLYADTYLWDFVPDSTTLNEVQHIFDSEVKGLQGLGFDLHESLESGLMYNIPYKAQLYILQQIIEWGGAWTNASKNNWQGITKPSVQASSMLFFFLKIWADPQYSHSIGMTEDPDKDILFQFLEKYAVDVFKYECLLYGVNLFKDAVVGNGKKWLREKYLKFKEYLNNPDNTFDGDLRGHVAESNASYWLLKQYIKALEPMLMSQTTSVLVTNKPPKPLCHDEL